MKIVSVDQVFLSPKHLQELNKLGEVVVYGDVPSRAGGIQRIKDAEIVIDNWFKMPAEVIAAAEKLQMICVATTGYEWIDLKEARKRKVVVCNCPGYGSEAVAEHALGLLLQAARLAFKAQEDIRAGKWTPHEYRGKELKGKTLGIIGYGNIGRRIGEIAQNGLGVAILYTTGSSSKADLKNLLQHSDFISINAPLTDQTRGMLGEAEFGLMKNGVVLANAGRGAIIDEQALVNNLKSGKVFAAGLDVLTIEPMDKNNPLFSLPNVVITPHIGFNTQEAEARLSAMVVENIKRFVEGKPRNVVSLRFRPSSGLI